MPPTFPIVLGMIVYLGLNVVTLVVFLPMLFFDNTNILAKKVISTVIISFPCLLVMGLFWGIVFIIPAVAYSWIAVFLLDTGFLPKAPVTIIGVTGFLLLTGLVATSALYLWYFLSRIIYRLIEKKSFQDLINKDSIFKLLHPYLIKLNVYSQVE